MLDILEYYRNTVVPVEEPAIEPLYNDIVNNFLEKGVIYGNGEDKAFLEQIVLRLTDICITVSSKYMEMTHAADTFVFAGYVIWERFSNRVNELRIHIIGNDENETFQIDPRGYLYILMSLPDQVRNPMVPVFEVLFLDALADYQKMNEAANASTDDMINVPWKSEDDQKEQWSRIDPEIHDDIFKDTNMAELLNLFIKLGQYRPNRDYDTDEKLELHDKIDELLNKMFRSDN